MGVRLVAWTSRSRSLCRHLHIIPLGEDRITYIDLDLDVIRFRNGRVDRDECEAHRVAFAYADEIVQSANAAADRVVDLTLAMPHRSMDRRPVTGYGWPAPSRSPAVSFAPPVPATSLCLDERIDFGIQRSLICYVDVDLLRMVDA